MFKLTCRFRCDTAELSTFVNLFLPCVCIMHCMQHDMYNLGSANWEVSGLPELPFDLKITDADGHELVIRWGRCT